MEEIKKTNCHEGRETYAPPVVECAAIRVENGFADSPFNLDQPNDNSLGDL